jgi:hypothetical protein
LGRTALRQGINVRIEAGGEDIDRIAERMNAMASGESRTSLGAVRTMRNHELICLTEAVARLRRREVSSLDLFDAASDRIAQLSRR